MRTRHIRRKTLRHKGFRRVALSAALMAFLAFPSAAQQTPAEAAARASEIQRRQEQELEAQRARAAPDVLSAPEAPAAGEGPLVFSQESPCFVLREVVWDGALPPADLRKLAATAVGPCVGGLGLKTLQEHLHARLIDQGRVTARVLVPEQSLAAGTLTLRYVPGRISAVQSEGAAGWWRTALPTGRAAS